MKILMIGHSHLKTLAQAALAAGPDALPAVDAGVVDLRSPALRSPEEFDEEGRQNGPKKLSGIDREALCAAIDGHAPCDATLLCLNGNEHTVLGLLRGVTTQRERREQSLLRSVRGNLAEWLGFLLPLVPQPVLLALPPPPIRSEEHIRRVLRRLDSDAAMEDPATRRRLWELQCGAMREVAGRHGVAVLEHDATVFAPDGFLADDCIGNDSSHGGVAYGERQFGAARRWFAARLPDLAARAAAAPTPTAPARPRAANPYSALPAAAFWKQAVATVPAAEFDPVSAVRFRIGRHDRVATAGSCFAQHISRRLQAGGFNFLQTETPDTDAAADDPAYHFSAAFGNIYTSRQLLQLFQRAFGYFVPLERAWQRSDGRYCDPFRPRLRAAGFPSAEAVVAAADAHLACVRRMFLELDVFVFTLGLTECWVSLPDGAALPLAPGVAGGRHDPARHRFLNLSCAEVVADLEALVVALRQVNPAARVLLTVSPVPLVATASGEHVAVANARSKAVLRAAADELVARHAHLAYFPSYEIIAGVPGGTDYMAADRRSVTEAGVDRVMRLFLRHLTEQDGGGAGADAAVEAMIEAECDEVALER